LSGLLLDHAPSESWAAAAQLDENGPNRWSGLAAVLPARLGPTNALGARDP